MTEFPLSYNEIDAEAITQVLRAFGGKPHEEIVSEVESRLSKLSGSPYALALQSGTAALHLALKVAGVKSGDFVIVPSFAYVATASPVKYLGAHPIFIDSELDSWNMDPKQARKAMEELRREGKRVSAMVVVHNYGMPARMDALLEIGKEFNIPLIEDAAESFGSAYRGKWTGTLGDLGVYSFNSNKGVTAFGGGAMLARREEHMSRARYLAMHARSAVPSYEHGEIGFNYRMSPLTAAYLLSQLREVQELFQRRRNVFESYRLFGERQGLIFQMGTEPCDFQPWIPAFLLPRSVHPGEVLKVLAKNGIEGRRLWKPLHEQSVFQGSRYFGETVAAQLFDRGICASVGKNKVAPEEFVPKVLDLCK